MIEAPSIVPMFPAYYIFNGLLVGLQVLHVIWSWMILRLALQSIASGKLDRDLRSDESEESVGKSNSEVDGRNGIVCSASQFANSSHLDASIKSSGHVAASGQ